jgi:transposase
MKYIPAYTPEFNPIKQVFSQIKSHYINPNHDNIKEDIIQSLMLVSS